MPLSNIEVRRAEATERPYKLTDERSLYLLVTPLGAKLWRFKYRFGGKEKTLAIGVYDDVSLAEARIAREAARKLLKAGVDPNVDKKQKKVEQVTAAQNTFEAVARDWHENRIRGWTPDHAERVLHSLEIDVFPTLGSRPVSEITVGEILTALRVVESRGALEVASRLKQRCSAVFRYAIVTNRATSDPTRDLKDALTRKPPVVHYKALAASELPEFLRALSEYGGRQQTKLALRLLMLTVARTGELRAAEWTEIDEKAAEWRIPAARMKMRVEHVVPLSTQALAALAELRALNGHRPRVFMNYADHDGIMSENALLCAIHKMGFQSQTTGHGMRSTFSTIVNELADTPELAKLGDVSALVELALAHAKRDRVAGAYNRGTRLDARRKLLQWWADHLDTLEAGADVVPLHKAA